MRLSLRECSSQADWSARVTGLSIFEDDLLQQTRLSGVYYLGDLHPTQKGREHGDGRLA